VYKARQKPLKRLFKDELPYGPNATHLNQLAYYMAITGAKKRTTLVCYIDK
jgi:hypothetical protein